MTSGAVIRIGTRASELALRQAGVVQLALEERGIATEIVTFRTTGDKQLDKPLSAIGGKGLFTRELEVALARKKVDVCVHSLKDLPTESPPGLRIAAMLEREDPRDVLVANQMLSLQSVADIPAGTRIGTSSLRRRAQLLALRPDVEVAELRGNVPTRLRKVDEGRVHAAILAAAGLRRLGVSQRATLVLEPPEWLPAAGQGVIAVQCREGDEHTGELLARLHDRDTYVCATAERAFLEGLEGGCQVPIGALCRNTGAGYTLDGMIAAVDGRTIVRGNIAVDGAHPEAAGRKLATHVRAQGGEELIRLVRDIQGVPSPQPE